MVWVSGLRLARAMGLGSSISGRVRPGWAWPCRERSWKPLRRVSAWSIWSQAAAKFSPIGPTSGPRAMQYCRSAADFGLVGVGAGAGVDAQLGFEGVADSAGLDEADQALGEGRGLGAGG